VLSLRSAGAGERQVRIVGVRDRAREVENETRSQDDRNTLANAMSTQTACHIGRIETSLVPYGGSKGALVEST
jgi:hypothetical protein